MRRSNWLGLIAGLAVVGSTAGAQAVVSNGTVSLGVFEEGHLNFSGFGVRYLPTGNDGTSPGCHCEGWGAGVTGGVLGRASQDNGGIAGITPISFASTATTATSVVEIGGALRVTHAYSPSTTANLYRVDVTLENLTNGVLGAGDRPIRYQRTMDWDIGPTEFDEFVTIAGSVGAANVIGTNNNGFDVPNLVLDPVPGCPNLTGDFFRAGPCDHGANFLFGFDALAVGASRTFTIFYGAATTRSLAINALSSVGAEIYSLGECNPAASVECLADGTPNTFAFGFAGVGGTVIPPSTVPEPSTYVLMATGLAAIAGVARRRRNNA
jgi:hypothetical protein